MVSRDPLLQMKNLILEIETQSLSINLIGTTPLNPRGHENMAILIDIFLFYHVTLITKFFADSM